MAGKTLTHDKIPIEALPKSSRASLNLGNEHEAKEVILVSVLHLLQSLNNLANLA